MAYQGITTAPIESADSLLQGGVKINSNFTEIYDGLANASGEIAEEVSIGGATPITYTKVTPDVRFSPNSEYETLRYYAANATIPEPIQQLQNGDFYVQYTNTSAVTPNAEITLRLPQNPVFGNKVSIHKGTATQSIRVIPSSLPSNSPANNILGFSPGDIGTPSGIILDVPNTTYTFVYVGRPYQSDLRRLSAAIAENVSENVKGWVLV